MLDTDFERIFENLFKTHFILFSSKEKKVQGLKAQGAQRAPSQPKVLERGHVVPKMYFIL